MAEEEGDSDDSDDSEGESNASDGSGDEEEGSKHRHRMGRRPRKASGQDNEEEAGLTAADDADLASKDRPMPSTKKSKRQSAIIE